MQIPLAARAQQLDEMRRIGVLFLGTLRDEFEMYPAKGTAAVPIRYGRPELSRYLGPGRSALAPILGDALPLTAGSAAAG